MKLPPKSILTNTQAIVSACEWEEVSASCDREEGMTKSQPLKFVLVTELAALLHLGSYTHARHLWHRHHPTVYTPTSQQPHENEEGGGNGTNTTNDPEYDQFQHLWTAAQPLLLASASPSIQPLFHPSSETTSNTTTTTTTPPTSAPYPTQSMDLQSSRKTFYSQLRSIATSSTTTTTPLQPLATYAKELILSQRMQMVRLLEETYDTIPRDDPDHNHNHHHSNTSRLQDLLGYENRTDLEQFLTSREWILEDDGFWIPGETYLREELCDSSVSLPSSTTVYEKDTTGFGLFDGGANDETGRDDKIRFLTGLVGFMERQGLDANVSREVTK